MSSKQKELMKCPSCKGKKQVMGLGLNYKDCSDCKGVGYKEKVEDEISFLESKRHIVKDLRSIGGEMKVRKSRIPGKTTKLREKYS